MITLILGIIGTLLVVGLVFYLLYLNYKDDEIKEEPVYIENFMTQYTEGHKQGVLKNRVYGKGRSVFTFLPLDINYQRNEKVEFQHVAVLNSRVKVFPKGTWSKNATVIWLLPPTSDELPEIIKNSPEGKVIVKMIEDSITKEEENEILRSAGQVRSKIQLDSQGLKVVDEYMNLEKALRTDWAKKHINSDKKQDNSFIPNNHQGGM